MKRFILFSILVCSGAFYICAAELRITSFIQIGEVNNIKDVDKNKTPCSKIIIEWQNEIDSVNYEGNIFKESKDYILLPYTAQYFTIQTPGYLPLNIRFEDYNIKKLEAYKTYKIQIENPVKSLIVDKIVFLENDPTAISQKKIDSNGNPCALLLINLALNGAAFHGQKYLYHNPEDDKISQYWVYVEEGTAFLDIRVHGYKPIHIEFAKKGIKHIEKLKTYEVTIIEAKREESSHGYSVQNNQDISIVEVRFITTPVTADIIIDHSRKNPDSNGRIALTEGKHEVLISADNYEPSYESNWIVSKDTKEYNCHLKKKTKLITLSTSQDVTWYIDNNCRGNGKSIKIDMEYGNHSISASGTNAQGNKYIYVDSDSDSKYKITLEKDETERNDYKKKTYRANTSTSRRALYRPINIKKINTEINYAETLENFYNLNAKIQLNWFAAEAYVGTGWGVTLSALEWRFYMIELAPLSFDFGGNFLSLPPHIRTKNELNISYAPTVRAYFPWGNGENFATFAAGPIISMENSNWFMVEGGYGQNKGGLLNWRLFVRYNGHLSVGAAIKFARHINRD